MPTTRRRAATWPTSVIHTPRELDRKRRRLDRQRCSAEQVLNEMQRRGATLHLSFSPREHWVLSTGTFVTSDIAHVVIANPNVAGVGDTLLGGGPSQTFRYVTQEEEVP
jgi:hypothetical protein